MTGLLLALTHLDRPCWAAQRLVAWLLRASFDRERPMALRRRDDRLAN
jgi:hypothetical protein